MPRLPKHGDTNWGSILNEFLLASHHEDGSHRSAMDVANVRDFGAMPDGSQEPEALAAAIQAAANTGMHVYIPNGRYPFTTWEFTREFQRITFAPDAILTPVSETSQLRFKGSFQTIDNLRVFVPQAVPGEEGSASGVYSWPDGLVHFNAPDQTVRNLNVEAHAPIAMLVKISQATGSRFEYIRILAYSTVCGVYIERSIKPMFVGGEIKGNNGFVKIRGSVGLFLGADKNSPPGEYGRSGVFELRAFGLTVHHWETGVRIAGQTQDDPTFMGCNFENNTMYGVRIDPMVNQHNESGAGAVRNLNLFGCHFEGTFQSIYVAVPATLQSSTISGCIFGMLIPAADEGKIPPEQILPQRVINGQGVLRGVVMTGCVTFGKNYKPDAYIWQVAASVRDCIDLFNFWSDMPGATPDKPAGNFATGGYADRVFRVHSHYGSGDGRTMNIESSLRHGGDRLGFFQVEPVPRPGGYSVLRPEGVTLTQLSAVLNKLVDDLASLGLIAKA